MLSDVSLLLHDVRKVVHSLALLGGTDNHVVNERTCGSHMGFSSKISLSGSESSGVPCTELSVNELPDLLGHQKTRFDVGK